MCAKILDPLDFTGGFYIGILLQNNYKLRIFLYSVHLLTRNLLFSKAYAVGINYNFNEPVFV